MYALLSKFNNLTKVFSKEPTYGRTTTQVQSPRKISQQPRRLVQSPPKRSASSNRRFFVGAKRGAPEIPSPAAVTSPPAGRSAISTPLPIDAATGKPAALVRPRNGYQSADTLGVNTLDGTGRGLSPSGVTPSEELARRHTTKS